MLVAAVDAPAQTLPPTAFVAIDAPFASANSRTATVRSLQELAVDADANETRQRSTSPARPAASKPPHLTEDAPVLRSLNEALQKKPAAASQLSGCTIAWS